jgi:tRNA modification GTPase
MHDTIVAISSALAPGLRGIVRLSGPQAFAIARQQYVGVLPLPYGYAHGEFKLAAWSTTIYGTLYFMRTPFSYTGEDVAEIHTWSALPLLHRLIAQMIEAGARPAQPGEFTRRAFLSGRLDLAQAEAVQSLIAASHESERRLAILGISGALSDRLRQIQQEITAVLALLETYIDFVDEEVGPAPQQAMERQLSQVVAALVSMTASPPPLERTVATVCIIGLPNAGKSTLFNALLRQEAAITSPVPGTTLDYLSAECMLGGIPFRLIDTPGIMDEPPSVHARAQQKARATWQGADFLLYLVDGNAPLLPSHTTLLQELPAVPLLFVKSKSDLPSLWPESEIAQWRAGAEVVTVSLHMPESFARVEAWLTQKTRRAQECLEPLLLSMRQRYAAQEALMALQEGLTVLRAGVSYEFVAIDLRAALSAMRELLGAVTTEHLLDHIFAQFCLGK